MRFLVLLATAPLLLAQPPLTMFQAHLASGKAAIQQSRYLEADRNLRLAIDNAALRDDGLQLSEALDTLCDLDLLIGKYEDAVALAERSVAAIEKQFGPESPELSPHLKRLAGAYRAGSLTPKAIPVLERALAVDLAHSVAKDPKLPLDYDSLGSAYTEVKQHAEARNAYQKALQLRIELLGPDHAEISNSWFNIALLEERDQQPRAARSAYENALVISEKKFGEESYSLTGILDRLGLLLRREKRYGEAEPVLQRALSIREKSLGARHSDVAPALDNLALAYFYDNKFTEAEPLFTRSLQIWLATQGPYSPLVAQALDNLGGLYSAQQRYPEAEPLFKRALAIRERQDIESLANLALLYQARQDFKTADQYYQRAILIGEKGLGGEHFEITDTLEQYATFLRNTGKTAEANKVAARIRELRDHPRKEP